MRLRRWRTADLALAVSLLLAGAAASDSTLFECPKGRYRILLYSIVFYHILSYSIRILSYSIVFSPLTTIPPKHCFIFLDFLIKWICGDSNVIFQFLKKSVIQLEISLFLIQVIVRGVRMVCVGNTRNCWSTHRPACHLPVSSLGHAEMIEEGGVELPWPGSTGLVLQPLVSP